MFHLFDVKTMIETVGLFGIFAIVFCESGLFFAFFLPGDSLLFTAGFLAYQGILPIRELFIGVLLAAILAGYAGYWFGRKMGPKIFTKEDSFFFRKKYLEQTKKFYEKYGSKTVVLARFVPVIRTFSPIMAGVGEMNFPSFSAWNAQGAAAWILILIFAGYFLGHIFPQATNYLFPIAIIIIFLSILPGVWEWWRSKKKVLPYSEF